MSNETWTLRWEPMDPHRPDLPDYVLKSGNLTVGRVHNLDPAGQGTWTWSLTIPLGRHPGGAPIKEWHGEARTRAEAANWLKAAWRVWLEWAGLKQG